MELDLDALERTAQAATPGPWRWDENYGDPGDTGLALTNDARKEIVGAYNYHCCAFRDEPNVGADDAEHIATFDPPTALALIARVRELEAIVNDGGNQAAKYWRRLTAAEADANRRLRNLEETVAERDEARADRDRFRAVIEGAISHIESYRHINRYGDVVEASPVIDRLECALNDKDAEK